MKLNIVNGPEHWANRAEANRTEWSISEARVREIVREEIAWALSIKGDAPVSAPIVKKAKRRGAGRAPNLALYREMANHYEAGHTVLECAIKFGSCQATVRRALDTLGVEARPTNNQVRVNRRHEHADEIVAMREAGATLEQIGARFSFTRERARQILNAAGMDTHLRPLNADERAAVDRYVSGDSLSLAAEKFGVSTFKMRKLILRSGQQIRPGAKKRSALTAERAQKSAELYRAGFKMAEIAREIGCSKPEMVYRFLAIAGVKPSRNRGAGR